MQAHFKENAQQFRLKREHLQFYLFSKCCFGMLWKGISQRALCLSLGLWDLHLNKCSIFNEQIHHFLGSLCPLFSWKRPQSMQTLTLAPLSPVGFQGAHNLLMQSCVLIQHNPTLRRLNFQSKALWRWIHPAKRTHSTSLAEVYSHPAQPSEEMLWMPCGQVHGLGLLPLWKSLRCCLPIVCAPFTITCGLVERLSSYSDNLTFKVLMGSK